MSDSDTSRRGGEPKEDDIFGHLPDFRAQNSFGFDGIIQRDETSHLHVHWEKPRQAESGSQESQFRHSQSIVVECAAAGYEYLCVEDEAYAFENSILNSTCKKFAHYWLANAKSAGFEAAQVEEFGPDLLEGFPDDIRDSNSLHLVSFTDDVARKYVFDLVNADAATALASNNDPSSIAEQLKFCKAWFLKPGNLEFHLQKGSRQLIQILLGQFEFILVFDQGEPGRFRLYNNPDTSKAWQDLGLPFAPKN